MNKNDIPSRKDVFFIKIHFVLAIIMLSGLNYYVIKSVALRSFISLIHHGDIIYYYPMSMACMGGIPFMLYAISLLFRGLFLKEIKPIVEKTFIGVIALPVSTVIVIIFVIASYLVPFWLIFSAYQTCPEKSLNYYYVIDVGLCKMIVLPR